MKPLVNNIGKTFGQLKVTHCVEPSDGNNKGGKWMCMCKCRRMITLTGYQLHSRKSCGCLAKKAREQMGKNNRKSDKEKAITLGYRRYKKALNDLNKNFPGTELKMVSREEWIKIAGESCYYCADMGLCEVIENIPICGKCYTIKGKLSDEEFIQQIEVIYLNLNKKPG